MKFFRTFWIAKKKVWNLNNYSITLPFDNESQQETVRLLTHSDLDAI